MAEPIFYLTQIGLFLCGVTALFLLSSKTQRRRYIGGWVGAVGQIFWLYAAITSGQFGILLMCPFYTWGYFRAVWNNRAEPA